MNFFYTGENNFKKKVNLRGRQDEEKSRDELLISARKNREDTKQEKLASRSCHKISICYQRHVIRKKFKNELRGRIDDIIKSSTVELETLSSLVSNILYIFNEKYDIDRFLSISKLLIYNMTKMKNKMFSKVTKKHHFRQILKLVAICGQIVQNSSVNDQQRTILLTLIYLLTMEKNFET
jgi:hypothetical protein